MPDGRGSYWGLRAGAAIGSRTVNLAADFVMQQSRPSDSGDGTGCGLGSEVPRFGGLASGPELGQCGVSCTLFANAAR